MSQKMHDLKSGDTFISFDHCSIVLSAVESENGMVIITYFTNEFPNRALRLGRSYIISRTFNAESLLPQTIDLLQK
jgi:hypothetical protein